MMSRSALFLAFGLAGHPAAATSAAFEDTRKPIASLNAQHTPSDMPKPQMIVNEAMIHRRRKAGLEIVLVKPEI